MDELDTAHICYIMTLIIAIYVLPFLVKYKEKCLGKYGIYDQDWEGCAWWNGFHCEKLTQTLVIMTPCAIFFPAHIVSEILKYDPCEREHNLIHVLFF